MHNKPDNKNKKINTILSENFLDFVMNTAQIVVQKTPKLYIISVSANEMYKAPINQQTVVANEITHLNINNAVNELESL